MAKFYTDFGGYTTGDISTESNITTHFTAETVNAGWTQQVHADAGYTGGKAAYIDRTGTNGDGENTIIYTMSSATQLEVLARWKIEVATQANVQVGPIIADIAANTAVGLRFVDGSNLQLAQFVLNTNNKTVQPGDLDEANITFAVAADTYYWTRLTMDGSSWTVKIWAGAVGDEPGTLTTSNSRQGTDGSYSSGGAVAGFYLFRRQMERLTTDVFAVGTGGDAAPTSQTLSVGDSLVGSSGSGDLSRIVQAAKLNGVLQ